MTTRMVETATAPDPTEAAAIAAADAQDEAALDRIVGSDDTANPVPAQDAAPAPTDGRARDASGKFASKTDTPAETESSEPSEAPTNDATPEYKNALKALQRDGVPQEAIDSMEPEAVIAWGTKKAASQLDMDRISSKKAELERAIALMQDKSQATADTKADILDDVVSEFNDFYGEEAGELQRKFGETIVNKMTEAMDDQRKQLQTIVDRMQAQEQVEARKTLSDRYDLSDEQRWMAVQAYMAKDANTHATAHEAVLSACRQLFADEPHPEQVAAEHAARSNGQPTTEHRTTPPASAPTMDDLEDHLIDAIEDGNAEERDRLQREINRRSAVPLMYEGKVGVK